MAKEASFRQHIHLLNQLDSQDMEVIRLNGEISTLREQMAFRKGTVQRQQKAVADTDAEIVAARQLIAESERELERIAGRIKRTEGFEGVKHNKDFEAAKNELVLLANKKSDVEEKALEALMSLDDLQPQKKKLVGQLKVLLSGYELFRGEMKTLYGKLTADLKAAKSERLALIDELGRLDGAVQERYLWLMNKHGDRASTLVNDNRCDYCHLPVIVHQVGEVIGAKALHYCGSCSRYLAVGNRSKSQLEEV